MISTKFKIVSATFVATVLGVSIAQLSLNKEISVILPRGTDYTLDFSGKKISDATSSYVGEKTATVKTTLGNDITFKAANVIDNDGGWQTILPGGYFYNPIDASANHNKLSGMTSISFTSANASKLSLHYGSTIDDENIIYSRTVELSANTPYAFEEGTPAFIYIKNEGVSNVDISNLTINYSCQDTGYAKKNYKVLMIGNSYSDDTIFFANRIAESYGINLTIVDAYIANCNIATHYNNLVNSTAAYTLKTIVGGNWYNVAESVPLGAAFADPETKWDLITFQQASASSGVASSYEDLEDFTTAIRTLAGNKTKFDWYQTWSYDTGYTSSTNEFATFNNDNNTMFAAINSCYTSEVASLGVFDKMIPAGTVVQNARTSFLKETFTRDFKHMSSIHGRYLLGLNLISSIFDIDLDMSPCTYIPTNVDAQFVNVAKESIRNAYNTPLAKTESVYKNREVAGYDLSQFTEIDAELVGCSFWNSTDASNYNKRQANVAGTSNKYVTTKRFTPETLPVGSLVTIDDEFGIRPEAWVNDAQQSSRPAEINTRAVEINSEFWAGYAYRAFNIFKVGASGKLELKGMYNQIFDGFHVYVPTASLGSIQPKTYNAEYASDKTLLAGSYLNIDAFERLHLDPITGFYNCTSSVDLTNGYSDDNGKKFVCSRPFYTVNDDLPENTVIVCDSGYQWRSDAWEAYDKASARPGNVTDALTKLDSSFMSAYRMRTLNVSANPTSYVNQNHISVMNHVRVYIPVTDDIEIEHEDLLTMTVHGSATVAGNSVNLQMTLTGDDSSHIKFLVNGADIGAEKYIYNKDTNVLTINANFSYLIIKITKIEGIISKENETFSNIRISGDNVSYIQNNGSLMMRSQFHDSCDYSSNAASQEVWQRRYNDPWSYNSGNGEWTTSSTTYHMEENHSMGLRIANNSYGRTSFFLKNDFNNGNGITAKHFSMWVYNPVGDFIKMIRIYYYTGPSTIDDNHKVPSSSYGIVVTKNYETEPLAKGSWVNIQSGFTESTIYNIAIFVQVKSNVTANNYLYLAHLSII